MLEKLSESNPAEVEFVFDSSKITPSKDSIDEEKLIDVLWDIKEGKVHPNKAYVHIMSSFKKNNDDT